MGYLEQIHGWLPIYAAVCAAGLLIIGAGVIFKRRWAKRQLEALRKKYQETDVSDPEYNAVRALYISALIDQDRLSGADPPAPGGSHDGDAGSGSGDGGGGGGD